MLLTFQTAKKLDAFFSDLVGSAVFLSAFPHVAILDEKIEYAFKSAVGATPLNRSLLKLSST